MGLISWLIAIPFITMVAVVCVPERHWRAIRWISASGTGLHLLLTAVMVTRYWREASADMASMKTAMLTKLYLVERVSWFDSLGIQYFVGVDGISASMVILTSIIIFTGVLASWYVENRTKEFYALLLLLVTGVFGVFLSFDLFLFFMFYEVGRAADVPPYRHLGDRPQRVQRHEAHPDAARRQRVHSRGLPRALQRVRPLHLRLAATGASPLSDRLPELGVPHHLHRVRRAGRVVSVAHVVARRPQFRANGRIHVTRGRAHETRRLRRVAYCRVPAAGRAPSTGACSSWP